MTVSPRTLTISAALILCALSLSGAVLVDSSFGGGIAATGALMLVNLLMWTATIQKLFVAWASGQAPALAAILYSLKLLLLAGGLVLLSTHFPPLSVVLGASVVVMGIAAHAVVGLGTELQVGKG